jgi:CPA1 family monovalent cation:H+ antiporter
VKYAELILVLQLVTAALIFFAGRMRISYPVFLVIGGLVLSFIPMGPHPQLNPDIVFLLFLPPILYYSALLADWREFRANLSVITALAVALVLFTTGLVAVVAHYWMGLPWAFGLILGAIISPPDAVAATAVIQTLRVPTSLSTIIEGESLVNDATALVVYQFAIGSVVRGHFTAVGIGRAFVLEVVGGLILGLVLGWLSLHARRLLRDSPVAIMLAITTPFFIYITGQVLGVSGVLATVAAGLYVGHVGLGLITPALRMQTRAIWDAVVFMINGFAFVLIGLQLPHVAEGLRSSGTLGSLTAQAIVICIAVVAARFLFILPGYGLIRYWRSRHHPTLQRPPLGWRGAVLVSWAGMRGIVSLAAALAVPLTLSDNTDFPYRQEIIFVSFFVIVYTLIAQGLSLPFFIHRLHLDTANDDHVEEARATLAMANTALQELESIRAHEKLPDYFEAYLRQRYLELQESANRDAGQASPDYLDYPGRARIWRLLLEAERRQLLHLRNTAQISDPVFVRLLGRLDHREATL